MKVNGADLEEGDVIVRPHFSMGPDYALITRLVPVYFGGVSISYEGYHKGRLERLASYVSPDRRVEIIDRDTPLHVVDCPMTNVRSEERTACICDDDMWEGPRETFEGCGGLGKVNHPGLADLPDPCRTTRG